ncbi:MAG: hypothetical protein IBJ03_15755 [Gemmatimonadaceae bacterium]|nr:hypothetical protein [Gemmatimonadaceae bacterium]
MLLLSALLSAVTSLPAQGTPRTLSQYHHTAWTVSDGAPGEVQALAQTANGYLWLGTATGLFRFDGVTFERYEPRGSRLRSSDITALAVGPGDALWIGYRFGGASVLRGDTLTTYTEKEGLTAGTIFGFAFGADTVWTIGSGGLAQFDGRNWNQLGASHGINAAFGLAIAHDKRGSLWVHSRSGIYLRRKGRKRFRRVVEDINSNGTNTFRMAPDGVMWATSNTKGLQKLTDSSGTIVMRAAGIGASSTGSILFDSEGSLWVTDQQGLIRYTSMTPPSLFDGPPSEDQRVGPQQGLSGPTPLALFEDREGNVWAATAGGIDRFRRNPLNTVTLPPGMNWLGVTRGRQGEMWVASGSRAIVKVRDHVKDLGGNPVYIEAAFTDHQGVAWFAGPQSLWRGDGDLLEPLELPPEIGESPIQSIARDRSGGLWIGVVRDGLWRNRRGTWQRYPLPGQRGDIPLIMNPDASARMWFGFQDNRIGILEKGKLRILDDQHGLDIGTVMVVAHRKEHHWIGGERGVSLYAADRFVTPRGWRRFRGTSGIIETARGDLWLHTAVGIAHIAAADVERALRDSTFDAPFELMDHRDGLEGVVAQLRPLPTAAEGTDGRLWFWTTSRLVWIDTTPIVRNTIPPPVLITALQVGDRAYVESDSVHLPKGTRSLQLTYTAPSLTIPERVRFRYRLLGSDSTWQDVGTRRTAFFTNLSPGAYRFQVIASNNDGVWNTVGATRVFSIEPQFVETRWFVVLLVASTLTLLWFINMLRLRQVARAIRARYDAKLEERTRIAQELHDTLLQGFTGITLQLQSVQRVLPDRPQVAMDTLSRVLTIADRALRDARHMVWDMRAPELDETDLVDAVEAAARAAIGSTELRLEYLVHGQRRRLPLARETAVLRIAREAVMNVVRHAQATTVAITLQFETNLVKFEVRDDGRGLDPNEALAASREGHWGIEGARGRAQRLGGTFEICSAPGEGTRIRLSLPADG